MAYRLGITAPKYPYLFPKREVDASHPDVLIDRNRCILCGRCVRASRDVDGKHVFEFVGRGPTSDSRSTRRRLGDTNLDVTRPGGGGLPGRRDPEEARRLRRAGGPAASTITSRSAPRSNPSQARRSEMADGQTKSRNGRWQAASAATCRCWTSTTGSSISSSWSTSTSRRSTTSRSSRSAARWADRGRLLQRGERRVLRRLPRRTATCSSRSATAHHGRHPRDAQPIPLEECSARPTSNGPRAQPERQDPRHALSCRCCSTRSCLATRSSRSTITCPGCPPPADTLWEALSALLTDKLPYELQVRLPAAEVRPEAGCNHEESRYRAGDPCRGTRQGHDPAR
jgi:hypothetical protein